jgi:hypothetical protein
VVSALPAAVFVSYVYLLARTGAWSGPIRWSAASEVGLTDVAVLGIAAFVIALALNPLQFVLIQVFEGYWGTSAPARNLATVRILHHRQRRRSLQRRASADAGAGRTDRVRDQVHADESRRALGSYPDDADLVLPTRLGNVLRRYEATVGAQYGLDLLTVVPRLAMVAGEREVGYVQNQRTQLELALRTSFLALIAALFTTVFLWRHGGWMLVALVPYGVAYLAYRGAVAIAHEYATALAVLVDLNRFALFDRLRVEPPRNIDEERRLNRQLTRLFRFQRNNDVVRYDPVPRDAATPAPAEPADQPDPSA